LKNNTKTYSCPSLHHAVYLAPDMLRHCCKRFFVNGELRGDVKMFLVKNDEDINAKKILKAKRELYDSINCGDETPCSGCPFLTLDRWEPLDKLKINLLSIESHSVCNMRCVYCDETYYGGLKAKYSLHKLFEHFLTVNAFNKSTSMVWGGGEPTLMDNFDEIFQLYSKNLKPGKIKLFTNAIKYSDVIVKYLKNGKLTITISTDAGTQATFKKVRGVNAFDKVFKNIQRYYLAASSGIIIKYVFTDHNSTLEEIKSFLKQINKYGLNKCDFQLSSNYKSKELTNEQVLTIIYLYNELINNGAKTCHFDDHLRPRWNRIIKKICNNKNNDNCEFDFIVDYFSKLNDNKYIIWGAGQLGYLMIKEGQLLEQSKIAFFVDKDKNKQGQHLCGIEIKHPHFIKSVDYPIIIASSQFYNDIYGELIDNMAISKDRIMDSFII
tara:strand:+ start:2435 stop:3748 length:1314 start_codon:yes stop_codon:yes gene_type:complete